MIGYYDEQDKLIKLNPVFKKHKYEVHCKCCGYIKTLNTDNYDVNVGIVIIGFCNNCCLQTSVIPTQVLYTKNREKIYHI